MADINGNGRNGNGKGLWLIIGGVVAIGTLGLKVLDLSSSFGVKAEQLRTVQKEVEQLKSDYRHLLYRQQQQQQRPTQMNQQLQRYQDN